MPVIIHNGSNYDFHLLIKDLAKEFKSDMYRLGENSEKYISFSVKIDTKKLDTESINYDLKFIDSFRFIGSSLDSLVDNLSEINNKTCISCKEKNETTQYCEFVKLNNNRLMYKCLNCKAISYKPLQPLINNFSNTYRLPNNNNDKLLLLLRKGIYPYEYLDDWNKFNETQPPSIKDHYSNLNMKNISDKDYVRVKNVWNTFKIKNLGEYQDLYVQSYTLLLSDIFEAFRSKCIKEYELDPCYFVSAPNLSWQACLRKTNVKLELLTDIDMLLMFEKGIRGGISQAILKYAKANNKCMKCMKTYNKNIKSSYLQYIDANNLYGWAMCEKLPVKSFKWDGINKYTEEMIKNMLLYLK